MKSSTSNHPEHDPSHDLERILKATDKEKSAAEVLLSYGFSLTEFEDSIDTMDEEERSAALNLLFSDALRHDILEDCIACEIRARELGLVFVADEMKSKIVERFISVEDGKLSWPGFTSDKEFPQFKTLALAKLNGSWSIMMCRPPNNIINIAMLKEMKSAFEYLVESSKSTNWRGMPIVVLTGIGPKAFSVGGEIKEHLPPYVKDTIRSIHSLFRILVKSEMLTIAKIRGKALGAAFELVVACDFAIASNDAEFRHPEVELGCYPTIGVALYPFLLEWKTMVDIVFRGRKVSAAEAKDLRLINDAVKPEDLNKSVRALLDELEGRSSPVMKLARMAMLKGPAGRRQDEFLNAMSVIEKLYLNHLVKVEDMTEGINAFLDHRLPHFKGR